MRRHTKCAGIIYLCVPRRARGSERTSKPETSSWRTRTCCCTARITNRGLLMASKNKSRVQRARPEGRFFACFARAYTRYRKQTRLSCVRACVLAILTKPVEIVSLVTIDNLGARGNGIYPAIRERKKENCYACTRLENRSSKVME